MHALIYCKLTTYFLPFVVVVVLQKKGRTEFTPRAHADLSSLRTIMPTAMKELIGDPAPNAYEAPDVFNPTLHPPLGEIDVLNIVEAGPDFKSVMDPQIYKDFYETPKDNSMILKPGKGNALNTVCGADRCDGTLDSWCKRCADFHCLRSGQNDGRNGILMDSYSGWNIFKPLIKHGYIAIKFESWHGAGSVGKTKGWESINNETDSGRQLLLQTDRNLPSTTTTTTTDDQSRRRLKVPQSPKYCDEFRFEYAIDGKITSLNKTEYDAAHKQTQRVVEVATLLKDPAFTGGEEREVEVGVRLTGCKQSKVFRVTHLYYA
jgi:hypothetical protein